MISIETFLISGAEDQRFPWKQALHPWDVIYEQAIEHNTGSYMYINYAHSSTII